MKSPNIIQSIQIISAFLLSLLLSMPLSWGQQTSSIGKNSISITEESGGKQQIQIRKNGNSFDVQIKGFITLSDDDKDVVAISGGGYLKISKSAFGSKRRLVIEADRSGQLIRKYSVGWSEKNYEPDGRVWLAEVLPEIVRSSGVGAEDRVNRIYDRGGMTAIAKEIPLLDGDYVKTTYLKLVMCKKLDDSEVDQVIGLIGNQIKSDHYLAELLIENVDLFIETPNRLDAYVLACRSVQSDHYLTEILHKAVTSTNVSDNQMTSFLRAADGIQSDHYMSSLLIDLLEVREMNSVNIETLLGVGKKIQSDHYLTEVLQKALESSNLNDSAFNRLLENVNSIQSDHYATEVLTDVFKRNSVPEEAINKLLGIVAKSINSAHYQAECLKAMLDRQRLTTSNTTALVNAIRSMNSDSYIAEVMEEAADINDIQDQQLIQLLEVCATINSDHYLSESLQFFASKVNNRGENVKTAYRNAAKSINSETYYGAAMKAID